MPTDAMSAWLGVLTLLLGLGALYVRDRDRRRRARAADTPDVATRWPRAAQALLVAAAAVMGLNAWLVLG